MSVIVDTCVWTVFLNPKKPRIADAVEILGRLVQSRETIYLPGIVFQEVLQGIKSEKVREQIAESLKEFRWLEPSADTYRSAAELHCLAKSKGIALGTVDGLIASQCIESDSYLLTEDKGFQEIIRFSKLRLYPKIRLV